MKFETKIPADVAANMFSQGIDPAFIREMTERMVVGPLGVFVGFLQDAAGWRVLKEAPDDGT